MRYHFLSSISAPLHANVCNGKLNCYVCAHTVHTVYPKKYAHGFCFAVLCCGYTLTDFPISIRLTSLALWQSNDCPSASKATLMNMDKYFMWIHYERLHNHNKAKHNKTACIFLGIYCISSLIWHIIIPHMNYTWVVTPMSLLLNPKMQAFQQSRIADQFSVYGWARSGPMKTVTYIGYSLIGWDLPSP